MMGREDIPTMLLGLVLCLVVSYLGLSTAADPDLWGHVRFGQDILEAHAIPREDHYSFTSDQPWINHEWLSEVPMAAAFRLGGSAGLSALKFIVTIGVFAVAWLALRQADVRRPAAIGLLLLAALSVHHLVASVRPQLASLLLFTVTLSLMNGIGRGHSRLFFWMLPVFALWANSHGGWLVGAGMLVLWSVCLMASRTLKWEWAATGWALATVGSLLTPYGLELWRLLWETVGLGRADIVDWQPLHRTPVFLIPWTLTAWLLVAAWKRGGTRVLPLLIPPVVLGLAALRVVRLEGLFGMASVILLAPAFAGAGPVRLPLGQRPSRGDLITAGAVSLGMIGVAGVATYGSAVCIRLDPQLRQNAWMPEPEAIAFFKINHLEGRLLTYFDYGELGIWHLAPKLRVSYDGRRETVYSSAVRDAHARFYTSVDAARYARTLKADYIWLPLGLPVNTTLERDGWIAIFKGSRSVIYSPAAGDYVRPSPVVEPRCFPGP
jgi:hypothetical protein